MEINRYEKINKALYKLANTKDKEEVIYAGIDVANEVMHVLGIPYDQMQSGEDALYSPVKNSSFRNQKMEEWFQEHLFLRPARLAYCQYDGEFPIESMFYVLSSTPRKERIAATTQLFPNWEDAPLYMIPQYKVGVDFFLSPKTRALLFVVSKKGSLRVMELSERLSNTQIEILDKIQNCAIFSGINPKTGAREPLEPQRTIHKTIWEALELKSVNKKFYEGISEHFLLLCQHLKNNIPDGVSAEEIVEASKVFSSRLIGRMLFVWFLRKKEIINKDYKYFDVAGIDASEYYEKMLKKLFFATLNVPVKNRTEVGADTKTPYLNGGLFEAHDNDWADKCISFPENWFVTLYAHLDEFNFTTDESSPEYEQVAIDPEMLGRVFENLLASIVPETSEVASERNQKGTFYTPREIVSYMCKTSLKEYIKKCYQTDINDEGIDKLIDMSDSDYLSYKSSGMAELWGVRSNDVKAEIIEMLNKMKVIDPACGSGAFPIGMLQLLIKTYDRLSATYDEKIGKMRPLKPNEHNNLYLTKLFIIRNSLYGVDIEPMAIEISRLRAWLSLIIDDKQNVDPLPNLDFNFVCANTLLPLPEKEESLFEYTSYEERFNTLRNEYFNTHDKKAKDLLRLDFEKLYSEKTDDELAQSDRFKKLTTWDPFRISKPAGFFDPKTMFNTDGFSIVIGNPPYVQLQKDKEKSKNLYKPLNYETYEATGDLYCLFIEKGVSLLKEKNGVLAYITSNKWMRAAYGEKLRGFLAANNPMYLIDFGGTKVFDSATVDTDIIVVSKEKNKLKTKACRIELDKDKSETLDNLSDYIKQYATLMSVDNNNTWTILSSIEQAIKTKVEAVGIPLKEWDININYGIKTGNNEAFIIDSVKRQEILDNCSSKEERERTDAVIRPILRGRDIKAYSYEWAGLYLIATFPSRHYDIEKYPALKKYLLTFGQQKLAQTGEKNIDGIPNNNARKRTSNEWFETQDSISYWDDFYKPKIVWPSVGKTEYSLVPPDFYLLDTNYFFATSNPDFFLAILNSRIFRFEINSLDTAIGDGGAYRHYKYNLENIKIPDCVDIIVSYNNEETGNQKDDVNRKLYTYYGLTDEEIEYLEKQPL